MPTENDIRPADPTFSTIPLDAEIRKIWGPQWNKSEVAYEFSSGRKFELKTGDAAIYASSPDF